MIERRLSIVVLLALGMLVIPAGGEGTAAQEVQPQDAGSSSSAVNTIFTYQGRLDDGGSPANGAYDFRFRLYDSPLGDAQIGSSVDLEDVAVEGGIFTVALDFGNVFWEGARWIDIGVRPGASVDPYTDLTPREQIRPAPIALALPNVYQDESIPFVGIGRDYRIGSEYFGVYAPVRTDRGGMYIETQGGNAKPFYGYATEGSPRAWHEYDGATSKWHLNNGGNRVTVDSAGKVGVGTTSPEATLDVVGSIRSSEDTVIVVSAFDMIEADGFSQLTFAAKFTGRLEVTNNDVSGVRHVYVPVDLPGTLHGTQQKLKSLDVCYSLPVSGLFYQAYIETASVRHVDETFTGSNLLYEDVVPPVPAERCHTITADSPTPITGSVWIRFKLDMEPDATIEFGRMALTLTSQ
jgi:hypothetical protein